MRMVLILLFFTCANTGALICDHLLDDARNQHKFLTYNLQDGHLQFYTKQNNLRSYAQGIDGKQKFC
jgi:hypothetical protein